MIKKLLWGLLQFLPRNLKTLINVKRRERFWREEGVIFVHVPKAAGTSISYALYGRSLGHIPFRDIVKYSSLEDKKIFSFAFVRNPWDRAVSAYHFARYGGSDGAGMTNKGAYSEGNFSSFRMFCYWLKEQNLEDLDPVFKTQSSYLVSCNGALGVDYVGKVESLEQDLQRVSEVLGRKVVAGVKNVTKREEYQRYYDSSDLIALIGDLYREDVERFDYVFSSTKDESKS